MCLEIGGVIIWAGATDANFVSKRVKAIENIYASWKVV